MIINLGKAILEPIDYEELTVSATPVRLTPEKVAKAFAAEVRFEDGPLRYTVHSLTEDPSATVGLPAFDGRELPLLKPTMKKFSCVRIANDGKIRVLYYKRDYYYGEL